MKYFIAIVLSLITLQLNAQNYVYSYTDPCTGILKTITVPINGSITVSYYGEVGTFNGVDFQNGVFESWANQQLGQYQNVSPCSQIVGVTTTVGITQSTALNTISILGSLSAISDIAGATNILGGAVNTVSGTSSSESNNENTEKNGSSNSSSNNSSSSNGSISTSNPGGTQGSSSTQSTSSTTTPTQTSTSEGQTSNPNTQSTSSSTSSTTTGSSGATSTEVGTGTTGSESSAGTTSSEPTSTGSDPGNQSSTGGNGENGSSGGNGTGGSGGQTQETQETQTAPEESGKTNITAGSTNTIRGSTTTSGGSKSNKNGQAPAVIASADFVGFNFRESDVTTGLKATGGYTALRWDGKRSWGGLLDYTSALNGPNLTGFYAWIKKGQITLLSGTLTVGFEGRGTIYGTVSGGQMRSFKKVKNLKLVYMATVTYGAVYQTPFVGTAVIAGGMFDFKIGKRIDIKLMDLMVYSPYVSYYNDVVMKSPYVMIPSIGTNISITRKFKFNINAGGAWSLGQSTLNYTITCGTRLIVGQ